MSNELAINQSRELAAPSAPAGNLIALALQSGASPDAIKTLCELQWKQEERQAEQAFARDYAAMQSEMPRVKAQNIIPGKSGKVRSRFASFEDIMRQVQPILIRYGFGVSFDSELGDGRFIAVCKLTHKMGHSQCNRSAAAFSAPPECSKAQADGSTQSFAKRYALCDALNIVIEKQDNDGQGDDDARHIGAYITSQEAEALMTRCRAVGMGQKAVANLLAWLTAKDFAEVPADRLADALSKLDEYEVKKAGAKPAADKDAEWN